MGMPPGIAQQLSVKTLICWGVSQLSSMAQGKHKLKLKEHIQFSVYSDCINAEFQMITTQNDFESIITPPSGRRHKAGGFSASGPSGRIF